MKIKEKGRKGEKTITKLKLKRKGNKAAGDVNENIGVECFKRQVNKRGKIALILPSKTFGGH